MAQLFVNEEEPLSCPVGPVDGGRPARWSRLPCRTERQSLEQGVAVGPDKGVGLTYNETPDFPGLVTHGYWAGGTGGAVGTPRPLLWRKEQRAARL